MSQTINDIIQNSTHLSGNPIWVRVNTTLVQGFLYKCLLKVESPDGVLKGSPFIEEITPDVNGDAWFDISGLVDQYMEKRIHFPVTSRVHGYVDFAYDIWLSPGESYVDANGIPQEAFGDDFGLFVIKGRLPEYLLNRLTQNLETWYSYYPQAGRFLTNFPDVLSVSPYQPVKVWYRYPYDWTDIVATATATYSDGSTQVITQDFHVTRATLYELDLLPSTMGFIVDNGTKRIEKYTFTVTDFETRTFIVDWTYHEKYWYLFVDNGIGGIECFWLKGNVVYSPSGARTSSKFPSQRGTGTQTPTRIPNQQRRTRKWKINSGIFPREQLGFFDILLDTLHAWLAIPPADGSTDLADYDITPVIIDNTETILSDDSNVVLSLDIEITEAH